MKDAIGYLRVSTVEQGRSGVGLAAQRSDIESFGTREGFSVSPGIKTCRPGPVRMPCSCVRGSHRR